MTSLSGSLQKQAFKTVGHLCGLRHSEAHSEDQIAEKLGFGSAEAMYLQLRNWGIPDWLVYGKPSGQVRETSTGKRKRRARRAGEAIELPPAAGAAGLLKTALEELLKEIDELPHLNEVLQGERFVGMASEEHRYTYYFNRKQKGLSESEWNWLCRELGEDPSQEEFEYRTETALTALGASQAPAEPLTTLIGVYALTGGSTEPDRIQSLVDKLHPDPQSMDERRLQQAIQELKAKAKDVAKMVRGGVIRRGPTTEEVSPRYQEAASWVSVLRKRGEAESTIEQYLIEEEGLSKDEVDWVKSLQLSSPVDLE